MGLGRLDALVVEALQLLDRATLAPGPAADVDEEGIEMPDVRVPGAKLACLGETGLVPRYRLIVHPRASPPIGSMAGKAIR